MNETLPLRPEVSAFVARVREQLADLAPDEQQDLVDGLEADLGELVAERGPEALGDPMDYARELRTAAGHSPTLTASGSRRPISERWRHLLDASHARWDRVVEQLPVDLAGFVRSLQPVWWIVRGVIGARLVSDFFGWGSVSLLGLPLLVLAVVVSVQVGRGRIWPGTATARTGPRTVLLALNVAAVLLAPLLVAAYADTRVYDDGYEVPSGLALDGAPVTNVFPYDAQGRPLVGVQLYDEHGAALKVSSDPAYVDDGSFLVTYPWRNGSTSTYNVVPLPSRRQADAFPLDDAFTSSDPPTVTPPLANVSPVSLPGVGSSVLVSAREAADQRREVRALKAQVRRQARLIERLRGR